MEIRAKVRVKEVRKQVPFQKELKLTSKGESILRQICPLTNQVKVTKHVQILSPIH